MFQLYSLLSTMQGDESIHQQIF